MTARAFSSCATLVAVALTGCTPATRPLPPALVASTDHTGMVTAAPPARPVQLAPGEQMSFKVSVHGMEVAEMFISIGDRTTMEGADVVAVQSAIRTTKVAAMIKPVRNDFASWIDRKTGRSVLFSASENEGRDEQVVKEQVEMRFGDGKAAMHEVETDGTQTDSEQLIRGPSGYDFNSFLVFLRGWEGEPGARVEADVVRSTRLWRTTVVVGGYDNLDTALGEMAVVRYDGEAVRLTREGTLDPDGEKRQWSIWISDDADRVPVKLVGHTDYGDVVMALVAYKPAASTAQ